MAPYVLLWDPRPDRRDRLAQLVQSCGGQPHLLEPGAAPVTHWAGCSFAAALVGIADPASEAEPHSMLASSALGCDVVAYGDGWDSAPLGRRCEILLAGATCLLDSSRREFETIIAERVSASIRASLQRAEEQVQVAEAMARAGIVGESAPMRTLGRWILRVSALCDLPVLIEGDTGTGKELIARAIHALDPKRSRGPFVPLNCAALSPGLAEAELFGHRRGAYTGSTDNRRGLIRAAHGGVLFLDEIADLELALQGKLLRVLQEGRVLGVGEDREEAVNVRVIAATNRRLESVVDAGGFRMDLFHRLHVLVTRAPALSERADDVDLLVQHFLEKYPIRGRSVRAAPSFVAALKALTFPGNVRQLENIVRRAVVSSRGEAPLGVEDLPGEVWDQLVRQHRARQGPGTGQAVCPTPPHNLASVLEENAWNLSRALSSCEREFLQAALARSRGNQTEAARLLGITPRSVYSKLRKFRLVG